MSVKLREMKQIVRTGVFETNSSSSHSLSVARGDQEFVYDTIYPDQNGVIEVLGQEFGWGWSKHNDSMTKLAYAFQDSYGHEDLIKEVVMEQTGATEVIFDENGGYIDHDGVGTTSDLRSNKKDLRNFIFNKNSWLFIGNDNTEPDPTFFDVPEYKDGKMIKPEYKYELVIEGLDQTTKYMSYPGPEELSQGIDALTRDVYLQENGHFFTEDSIFWQISRPRNTYYTKDWGLEQDYNTNEIRFLKENDDRWYTLCRKLEADPEYKKLDWAKKHDVKTLEAMAVEGLVKKVKFTLNEL